MIRRVTIAFAVFLCWSRACFATDRWFEDIVAVSPDGEWKVTALSPDNYPWQEHFVYSAFNCRGSKLVWTREQAKQNPREYSPIRIVVGNDGWVAIQTAWDRLIFVDPDGRNRGRIDDLKQRLTKPDLQAFGVHSSEGLFWDPYSLWYFLSAQDQRLFVVRVWWGRRLIIDPGSGKTLPHGERTTQLARESEIESVFALLAKYVGDPIAKSDVSSILLGAHLAGTLQVKDAVPMLRYLERSEYTGITSARFGPRIEDGIDPFSFKCHTARQVARPSLRRLGQETSSLPIYEFTSSAPGNPHYHPKPIPDSLVARFPLVKRGMTAKEVLNVMGSPDFVVVNGWEFDSGGESPATFVVEWKDGRVLQTHKMSAKWKEGLTRDQHIVLF